MNLKNLIKKNYNLIIRLILIWISCRLNTKKLTLKTLLINYIIPLIKKMVIKLIITTLFSTYFGLCFRYIMAFFFFFQNFPYCQILVEATRDLISKINFEKIFSNGSPIILTEIINKQ